MDAYVKLTRLLQILGDASRLGIIRAVGTGKLSVSEIVESTKLSQPLVSHHLRTLRDNGIFEAERKGPFIYYFLHDPRLLDALGMLQDLSAGTKDLKSNKSSFCSPPWWREMWMMKNKR